MNRKAPLGMSDYPKGGDIASTRAWLDKEGFIGIFNNWEADAILGLPEKKIMVKVPGKRRNALGLSEHSSSDHR